MQMQCEYFPYQAFSSRATTTQKLLSPPLFLCVIMAMAVGLQSSSFKENNVAILWSFVGILFGNSLFDSDTFSQNKWFLGPP